MAILEEFIIKASEEAKGLTREELEEYYLDRRADELMKEWIGRSSSTGNNHDQGKSLDEMEGIV